MFNKFVTISLIVATLSLPIRFCFPYIWYFSNYDYIVKELCINKHIPGSDCNGSCQLSKMMHDHSSEPGYGEHNAPATVDIRTLFNYIFIQSATPDLTLSSDKNVNPFQYILHKTQHLKEPLTPPPLLLI